MSSQAHKKAPLFMLAGLILLFLLQGCGTSGSTDSVSYTGSSTASTYRLSGTIISPVTLAPVEGMNCTLESISKNAAKSSSHTTVTDSSGAYSFTGLPAGDYRLTTTRSGNITDTSYFTIAADYTINLTTISQSEWTTVMGADHPYDATKAYVSAMVDHTGTGTPPVQGTGLVKTSKDTGKDGVVVDLTSNKTGKGSGYQARCYMDTQGKADWNATSTTTTGVALFYNTSPDDAYTLTASKAGHSFNEVTDVTAVRGEFTNYMINAKEALGLKIKVMNSSGKKAYVKFTGKPITITPDNAEIASGYSQDFVLDSATSGRMLVSYESKLNNTEPDGANPGDADYYTRFDKVEFTYTYNQSWQSNTGKMNLTAVDFFSIPMILETSIDGTVIDHYTLAKNQTATTLNTALGELCNQSESAIIKSKDGTETLRILSPVKAPSAYRKFDDLLASLDGSDFTISGKYYGTPLKDYNYKGTFSGDSLTLADGDNTMVITKESLMYNATDSIDHNGIYTCNGAYTVNGNTKHVADNDIYAAVYRDLVTGFNLGYVQTGTNNSSGWWSQTPFTGSCYNEYAQKIGEIYPGAYGFPFTDRYRHILADLGRNSTGGIDAVTITLLDDTTSPPDFTYQGNVDPQSGVTTFNMSINAGDSNTDFSDTSFKFNTQNYKGGKCYDWPNTENQWSNGHTKFTVDINGIPAKEGLNIYNLIFSSLKQYKVLVKVENSTVKWASIAGGGGARWTSPVLYVGSVLD